MFRGIRLGGGEYVVSESDSHSSAFNEPTPRTLELLSLLGAHERSLFAYVCALTPNWQDAEEIMQQVRIRIWQDFDQYDPAKPFGSWARAIAYYLTLAFRKERSRQREFFSERILEEVSLAYETVAESANERRAAHLAAWKNWVNRSDTSLKSTTCRPSRHKKLPTGCRCPPTPCGSCYFGFARRCSIVSSGPCRAKCGVSRTCRL